MSWLSKAWNSLFGQLDQGESAPPAYGMPAKDPEDGSKTAGSTHWVLDKRSCLKCKASVHRDHAWGEFCPYCGTHDVYLLVHGSRVVRQIWDGEKWVFQYRYKEGKTEIVPARYRNSPIDY
jgi:hypothetical protein